MFKKIFLSLAIMLAVTVLSSLNLASKAYAQEDLNGNNFIFINYIGREMTFDLDDVTYTIPGTDTVPEGGRLNLQLSPGEHKYAANIPAVAGHAGEFTIEPGGYVAKAARLEKSDPVVDRNGILLEKPQDYVFVFDFDPFATPAEETPVVDTWQPAAPSPGQGALVFINYTGDELTVDIDGQVYKVAPSGNGIPGRLQFQLPPGSYRFTASVPYGSLNSEVALEAGQVAGLSITADPLPEREYEVGEEYDFHLPVTLHLSEEDLTALTNNGVAAPDGDVASGSTTQPADSAENAVSETEDAAAAPVEMPAVSDGLRVKNYAGDTLTFTINGQEYTIPSSDELTIPLPPGSYNYTASRPSAAVNGTVDLAPGQGVELSVAVNIEGDILNVYQN